MSRHANAGRVLTWTNDKGEKKIGIARHAKQSKAFTDVHKIFVEYVDERYQPIRDPETGKKYVGLVQAWKVKLIGFID